MTLSRTRTGAAIVAALTIVVAACGSDVQKAELGSPTSVTAPAATTTSATVATTAAAASTSAGPATAVTTTAAGPNVGYPVTIKASNGDVTIAARPTHIISLSPTATEMLFAIGAGSQVIAVDDQSNYPAEAPKTDLSGFRANVEAIAQKKPDLVVISDDSQKLSDALGKLSIATILEPPAKSLDDSYAQIEQLGLATGHSSEAAQLDVDIAKGVAAAVQKVVKHTPALSYYYELDNTYYTATSTTFVGQIAALFGLRNIADPADDGSGYPQLTAEKIAAANPDVVFLADVLCCQQSPEVVSARPGWNVIKAVAGKHVVALNDDVASRWGPRVVELANEIATALSTVPAA